MILWLVGLTCLGGTGPSVNTNTTINLMVDTQGMLGNFEDEGWDGYACNFSTWSSCVNSTASADSCNNDPESPCRRCTSTRGREQATHITCTNGSNGGMVFRFPAGGIFPVTEQVCFANFAHLASSWHPLVQPGLHQTMLMPSLATPLSHPLGFIAFNLRCNSVSEPNLNLASVYSVAYNHFHFNVISGPQPFLIISASICFLPCVVLCIWGFGGQFTIPPNTAIVGAANPNHSSDKTLQQIDVGGQTWFVVPASNTLCGNDPLCKNASAKGKYTPFKRTLYKLKRANYCNDRTTVPNQ